MSVVSFGYFARAHSQARPDIWLRLAGWIFWGGLALGLIFWWNGLVDPHEAPKQGIFALSLVFTIPALVIAATRGQKYRPFAWVTLLSLGLILISTIASWWHAPDHWFAFFGVAGSISTSVVSMLAALIACMCAGTLASMEWKPSSNATYGLLSGLTLVTLIQRLAWIDVSSGGIAARVFSPAGNEGALAWLIAIMTIFAIAQEAFANTYQSGALLRRFFLGIAVVWLILIDLTAIWWLLAAGLLVIACVSIFSKTIQVTQGALALIGLSLLIPLVGLIVHVPQPANIPTLVALSWQQSWQTVQVAWQQRGSFFGAGQGQWATVFESIRPVSLNLGSLYAIRFDTGGSYWWTLLLQQGTFGAIAWVAFLLFAAMKTHIHMRKQSEQLPLAIAVWSGVIATFVMQPHGWGIMLLFVALGYLLADQHETDVRTHRAWLIILGVFAVILLLSLPYSVQRLQGDQLLVRAQTAQSMDDRRTFAHQALNTAPWLADQAFVSTQTDTLWLESQLKQGIKDPTVFQQEMAAAIEASKAATTRWPTDPGLWLARGALYSVIAPVTKGADQFAIQAFQEGMKYAPHHPGFPLGIANIYLMRARDLANQSQTATDPRGEALAASRLEQLRLAAQWYKRALDQKPDDQSAQYQYASTLARSGSLDQAVPLFAALVKNNPAKKDLALEYATVLAATGRVSQAITIGETIGSEDTVYLDSRRLLAVWYEHEKRYAEAVAALRALPLSEQQTQAFRQKINQLQSISKTSTAQ